MVDRRPQFTGAKLEKEHDAKILSSERGRGRRKPSRVIATLGAGRHLGSSSKDDRARKSKMEPSFAVLNSGGAKLDGGVFTMSAVSAVSIVFADRPIRSARHGLTCDFTMQQGEGPESLTKDPANPTISVLSAKGDSISDAVVVLRRLPPQVQH